MGDATCSGEWRRGCFRGDEARETLEALRNFLSFANGGPCMLVCPSGCDENGDEVWAQWSSPYGAESVAFCWSGRRFAEPLVTLSPGFMTKWEDEGWRDALRTAIWWYTTANGGGALDSGIVSAQIAMERLAYEYCVRERALVSERGFDRLPTADRYRMFLASLEIPLDIGPSLGALELLGVLIFVAFKPFLDEGINSHDPAICPLFNR